MARKVGRALRPRSDDRTLRQRGAAHSAEMMSGRILEAAVRAEHTASFSQTIVNYRSFAEEWMNACRQRWPPRAEFTLVLNSHSHSRNNQLRFVRRESNISVSPC